MFTPRPNMNGGQDCPQGVDCDWLGCTYDHPEPAEPVDPPCGHAECKMTRDKRVFIAFAMLYCDHMVQAGEFVFV